MDCADCDARSSVSLLDSDSVYLPFNIPASPVVLRRPFTAPDREQQHLGRLNISTSSATAATATNTGRAYQKPGDSPLGPRPQTSSGSHHPPAASEGSSRYETLEQRPIRPLNQQLARAATALAGGGVYTRPSFEIARPLTSSSEPSVVGRSHHSKDGPAVPTSLACSQDYESSGEQTTGESESESATASHITNPENSSQIPNLGAQSFPHHSPNPGQQASHISGLPPSLVTQEQSSSSDSGAVGRESDGSSHSQLTPSTRAKLNHIRLVAGSRRSAASSTSAATTAGAASAAGKNISLRDKAAAVAKIRDGISNMRSASGSNTQRETLGTSPTANPSCTSSASTSTVSSTVTASSLAASAVMRAHKLKTTTRQQAGTHHDAGLAAGDGSGQASAFVINTNSRDSNQPIKLHKNISLLPVSHHHHNQPGATEVKDSPPPAVSRVGGRGSTFHMGGGDSKEVKGRLNLERMEQQKEEGGSAGVRDSGFLSRPPSEVVKDEPQQIDNRAATSIQAYWRGYWAREHNTQVVSARKEIRARRAEDHIMLLRNDLEKNRKLYEEEKRLRILQMEAIKILYHEVQALKSQSSVVTNDLNRSSQQHQTVFSPGSTATTISGGQGSPLATTGGSLTHYPSSGYGLVATGTTSSMGYTGYSSSSVGNSELNRTQELERTCASLQSQVSQLHEALESVSSAVFRTNSLDGTNFDLTDNSDTIQVTAYTDHQIRESLTYEEFSHWGCIPHSLSPYPSEEEEEQYYLRVPTQGAPTPPRRLTLQHHSRSALLLSWQPSSCCSHKDGGEEEEEEEKGNRYVIGYRVFVNDQLKAFVSQKTCVLVEGLNPSMPYKFYVKALSGFGESFGSNILMAKLAKGGERYHKPRQASSDESAHDSDSDKDLDSTENNSEKLRKRNRKMRKSPRLGGEKRKASTKVSSTTSHRTHHHHHQHHQGELMLLSPRSDSELALNQNTNNNHSAIAAGRSSPPAILRHPKLHTHRSSAGSRGHSSKDTSLPKDSHTSDTTTTSKEPSPSAGSSSRQVTSQADATEINVSAAADTGKRESGARKLPESPKLTSQEHSLAFGSQVTPQPAEANVQKLAEKNQEAKNVSEVFGVERDHRNRHPSGGSSSKPQSPSSGSVRLDSPSQRRDRNSSSSSRYQSPQVSPSCGSSETNTSKPVKVSPQPGGVTVMPPSPPVGSSVGGEASAGTEDVQASQSSSMSETFTVDKASSFLESVNAITESALAGKQPGPSSSSGARGHRRTRSRDLQAERLALEGVTTSSKDQDGQEAEADKSSSSSSRHRERKASGGSDGKKELERKISGGSDGKSETAGSDVSSKARGHRRKRSKDLNNSPNAEWQGGQGGEKKDALELGEGNPPVTETKGAAASSGRSIVLDGRRRHSSGSRPSSPLVTGVIIGGGGGLEERTRMSVAEMMLEQRKMLNKSSSLNSLSGRSEDGSLVRAEGGHKRSPSIESLPGSSKGDTSKRTVSNESLQSGGSSRGEGGGSSSKRTHSSESLLSIRTDTSKQSHSNESLPGSARTESSRRSPSNESLPESIREETSEQQQQQPQQQGSSSASSRTRLNPRRTQSMGSARDIGQSGEGSSSHSRGSNRMSDLLLKLESITKNNSTSVKEKKESLIVKQATPGSGGEDADCDHAGKHSDEERQRSGRRSRNLSESDAEGGVSDPGSQLPPRAPSDSSSGSHSDDNRHARRGHRRTPSDHRPPTSLPPEGDPTRPTHSPIIMEGGPMRKTSSSGGSNVLRNQSFRGILPSKHSDTKASPSSNEDISTKGEEQQPSIPAPPQTETPSRHRSHLRSRSPSPARSRQPVLSAAQLKRHGEGGSKQAPDPMG
ncbi:centrosomal protein of 97 kda [Plakobranchus ocellatus]|uniref:Centrosomal protein of 97 kDa n=1 Tax=Plakobranchus ocellatus TaxID=259542 RepID=A0AAV4A9U2_9GAST|nr:centrosomal protein of 97 kda [Plakobranchus ocellatus]